MEPNFLLEQFFVLVAPFLAFFCGVAIADVIDLHSDIPRLTVWLMSIPTGMVSTGLLMVSASVSIPNDGAGENGAIVLYGYMESIPKYAVFVGLLMFYGTATPELFQAIRNRIRSDLPRND